MKKYRIWVQLEGEYDEIYAENEDDAFEIASDYAMSGGSWDYEIIECEDVDDNEIDY